MSNFFRKISQLLVVLVLVSAVLPGHVFASESDSYFEAPSVTSDGALDTDVPDDSPDVDTPSDDLGGSGSGGSNIITSSPTASGANVTINVQQHDTFSVVSVFPDAGEESPFVYSSTDSDTPSLADTIRSLFGSYTPRTQTVTTYYDGQPISIEEQIVPGLAGLDYEWIAGVALFALIIFCLFRLLGGVLKHG